MAHIAKTGAAAPAERHYAHTQTARNESALSTHSEKDMQWTRNDQSLYLYLFTFSIWPFLRCVCASASNQHRP